MDWRKIKEHWDDYRAAAQRAWPDLEPDVVARSAGNRTELMRHLQDAYGWSQEDAALALDRWADTLTHDPQVQLETAPDPSS